MDRRTCCLAGLLLALTTTAAHAQLLLEVAPPAVRFHLDGQQLQFEWPVRPQWLVISRHDDGTCQLVLQALVHRSLQPRVGDQLTAEDGRVLPLTVTRVNATKLKSQWWEVLLEGPTKVRWRPPPGTIAPARNRIVIRTLALQFDSRGAVGRSIWRLYDDQGSYLWTLPLRY